MFLKKFKIVYYVLPLFFIGIYGYLEYTTNFSLKELLRRSIFYVEYLIDFSDNAKFIDNYTVINSQKNADKRVFLFHGLDSDANYWKLPEHKGLVDKLKKENVEIVILSLPYAKPGFFKTGLGRYCNDFSAWFKRIQNKLDNEEGIARLEIAFGESWGGFHSLIAASRGNVKYYLAVFPVVDVSALSEFWMVSSGDCNPIISAGDLGNAKGYIAYGSEDNRVDFRKAVQLISKLKGENSGLNLVTEKFIGADHGGGDPSYQASVNWILSQ